MDTERKVVRAGLNKLTGSCSDVVLIRVYHNEWCLEDLLGATKLQFTGPNNSVSGLLSSDTGFKVQSCNIIFPIHSRLNFTYIIRTC